MYYSTMECSKSINSSCMQSFAVFPAFSIICWTVYSKSTLKIPELVFDIRGYCFIFRRPKSLSFFNVSQLTFISSALFIGFLPTFYCNRFYSYFILRTLSDSTFVFVVVLIVLSLCDFLLSFLFQFFLAAVPKL